MPARTPNSKKDKGNERIASARNRRGTGAEDDNITAVSPGTPIATVIGNMSLRSGTKLSTKMYTYSDRSAGEADEFDSNVVAEPWPSPTPVRRRRTATAITSLSSPEAPPIESPEQPSKPWFPFFGTLVIICIVFLHWASRERHVAPAPARRDANIDREKVLSSVLRQQDNAIQHWRSQQNLMWPVVLDLERKLESLSRLLGHEIKASVSVLQAGSVPLLCHGETCTDAELERALGHLVEQSDLLASKLKITIAKPSPKTGRQVSIPVTIATEGIVEEKISSKYCEKIGKTSQTGSLTMKDELLCRGEYVIEATSRLLQSYTLMKAQFQERAEKQDLKLINLGVSLKEGDREDVSKFNPAVFAQSLYFKDLIEDSLKAEVAAYTREVLSVSPSDEDTVQRPASELQDVKRGIRTIVNEVAQLFINDNVVVNPNITSIMSAASRAKSLVGDDINALQDSLALTSNAAQESFITAVDVSEYVKEIIAKKKSDLSAAAKEQLSQIVVPIKEDEVKRPIGVFEYSSRIRGGRVYTKPIIDRLTDTATALIERASTTWLGKTNDASSAHKSFQWGSFLTIDPFALTGGKIDISGTTTEKLIAGTAIGSPSWAKRVLRTALGWGYENLGADPQVILNHLYPDEDYDEALKGSHAIAPGNCYAFASGEGNLTIELKNPIFLYSIALYHPSASLLPPPIPTSEALFDGSSGALGGISSAPRKFSVFAWFDSLEEGSNGTPPVHVGDFVYTALHSVRSGDMKELQEFNFDFKACPRCKDTVVKAVTVSFQTNHGNPLFTCVYRIKLFGRAENNF